MAVQPISLRAKLGTQTSGITMPPVPAVAVDKSMRTPKTKMQSQVSEEVYPAIRALPRIPVSRARPRWLGPAVVVHPWESGLDNSPPYSNAGKRVHMAYKPRYTRLDTTHVSAKTGRPTRITTSLSYLLEV